jgi:hypothetical protein
VAVDRRTIKILLAALDLEVRELADVMGYKPRYVVNVLNGVCPASLAFRRALGDTIATFLLGTHEPRTIDVYPSAPLVDLIEKRAANAADQREFYEDIGTSAQALRKRKFFDGIFIDRVCCRLGVHPSALYGQNYGLGDAS